MQSAGAHVQEVDAHVCEDLGELDGVLDLPALNVFFPLEPVGGGDTEEKGRAAGHLGAGQLDQFAREAGAVLEAAAVRVGASVAGGAEEGMEEVAAAGVVSRGFGSFIIFMISL